MWATIPSGVLLIMTNILNVMAGSAEDCGGPAGPAQAGGGQPGLLHHHHLELGAGFDPGRPGSTARPASSALVDQIYGPSVFPGHVSLHFLF